MSGKARLPAFREHRHDATGLYSQGLEAAETESDNLWGWFEKKPPTNGPRVPTTLPAVDPDGRP